MYQLKKFENLYIMICSTEKIILLMHDLYIYIIKSNGFKYTIKWILKSVFSCITS